MRAVLTPAQRSFASVVIVFLASAPTAHAQLGILTSALGSGRIGPADGESAPWRIGQNLHVNDRIATSAESFAMLFFVSGLGGSDIEFEGAIVVELDQNTTVQIRRGSGRRAPIDVYVVQGRARAFFDAGEHKDYILLSTPLGELQVTGSIIYAAHGTAEFAGTVLGSLDSDCIARVAGGAELVLSRLQKVILEPNVEPRIAGITLADTASWDSMPDLNLAAAKSQRAGVQAGYAGRIWVGEYVVAGERLEDVADESSANIPSQEPELRAVAPAGTVRTTEPAPRETRPRLRASNSSRSTGLAGDGVVRGDLAPNASQPLLVGPEISPGAGPKAGSSLRSAGLGRSVIDSSGGRSGAAVRP